MLVAIGFGIGSGLMLAMGLTIIFPMGVIGGIVYFTKEGVCIGLRVFTMGLGIAIGLMLAIGLIGVLSIGLIFGIAEIAILGIGLKVFTIGLGIVSGLMFAIGIAIGLMLAIGLTRVLFMGLIFGIVGVTSLGVGIGLKVFTMGLGIAIGLTLSIGLTITVFIGVILGITSLLNGCVAMVFIAGLVMGFIAGKGLICKLVIGIFSYFNLLRAMSNGISIFIGLIELFKFGMRVKDEGIL